MPNAPTTTELLAPRTTMGVGGAAERFLEVDRQSDAIEALRWATEHHLRVRVLGGGSNVVVADAGVDGLVIALRTRGISTRRHGESTLVTAMAGETWDDFVAHCVAEGLAGVECLSGIPGAVGATPIQNVGAYGQEVGDSIVEVHVYDTATAAILTLDRGECEFGYRDSAFKRRREGRYVVLSATFALKHGGAPKLSYSQLRSVLPEGTTPSLEETRELVLDLRRKKSMVYSAQDPFSRGCGSFFTNPVVDQRSLDVIARTADGIPPSWESSGGMNKLPAAWLIERAGYQRGHQRGRVGLSPHHSLAIVNLGGAMASDVIAFAREIQSAVEQRFGVMLAPEPAFWGYSAFADGIPLVLAD